MNDFVRRTWLEYVARGEAYQDQLAMHGTGAPPPSEEQIERWRQYIRQNPGGFPTADRGVDA